MQPATADPASFSAHLIHRRSHADRSWLCAAQRLPGSAADAARKKLQFPSSRQPLFKSLETGQTVIELWLQLLAHALAGCLLPQSVEPPTTGLGPPSLIFRTYQQDELSPQAARTGGQVGDAAAAAAAAAMLPRLHHQVHLFHDPGSFAAESGPDGFAFVSAELCQPAAVSLCCRGQHPVAVPSVGQPNLDAACCEPLPPCDIRCIS